MESRTCEGCGEPINLRREGAKTCSARCRKRVSRLTVPAALTTLPRWVRWDQVTRKGKPTKLPLTTAGRPASSTDPRTWTTHSTANRSTIGRGLGFVLNGDGLAVLDLDHCLIDGKPAPAAQALLDRFPEAWVERSPSGDGLHVWGRAESQPGRRTNIDGLDVEFYTRGRYMTVTGNTYRRGSVDVELSL